LEFSYGKEDGEERGRRRKMKKVESGRPLRRKGGMGKMIFLCANGKVSNKRKKRGNTPTFLFFFFGEKGREREIGGIKEISNLRYSPTRRGKKGDWETKKKRQHPLLPRKGGKKRKRDTHKKGMKKKRPFLAFFGEGGKRKEN